MSKSHFAITLIVIASFAVACVMYPVMPSIMASHWNSDGQVNGYLSKFWGVFLMPIISLTILLLFIIIPKIDPLKENIAKFRGTYDRFIVFIGLFLFYVYVLSLLLNLGLTFNMSFAILPALTVLFYFAGDLTAKAKRNYFIGIRTPWTLASDEIWDKTHQLGGKLFKVAAVVSLIGLLFPQHSFVIFIVAILAATFIPVIYSYLIWRKTY